MTDSDLEHCCYGNRVDLQSDKSGIRKGNSLFVQYYSLYKRWWRNGIDAANKALKEDQNVTIINFDLANYFHSVDFNFNEYFTFFSQRRPHFNLAEDRLTRVIIKIYERYWFLTQNSNVGVFQNQNKGKHPLPLDLMSSKMFANWYLSELDNYILDKYKPLYYGRYVDDCMVVVKSSTKSIDLKENIIADLPGLFSFSDEYICFSLDNQIEKYKNLKGLYVQNEKLYIYKFDCVLSKMTLEKFAHEQLERSSEYRFLTDEYDDSYDNFYKTSLIDCFDADEGCARRFNILEENKYRMSVYLSKLASRLSVDILDSNYEDSNHAQEIDSIIRYFKKSLLIKHYNLWEKIFTILVLGGREEYIPILQEEIIEQIENITCKDSVFLISNDVGLNNIKKSLTKHMQESILISKSLVGGIAGNVYLETFMIRMHYNRLPMQEFTALYREMGIKQTFDQLDYPSQWSSYRWIPYNVKYYDIVSALCLGQSYNPDIFEEAFEIYCSLNHFVLSSGWQAFFCHQQNNSMLGGEFNTSLARDEDNPNELTVSMVEMNISAEDAKEVINDFGKVYINKISIFQGILDQISKIKETDIFVMPELSLPIYELREYCRYSSKNEVAFISGMEYVVKNDLVYNYIITCLPITLFGEKDAIPVIRLKNYYAPAEEKMITKEGKNIPHNNIPWQLLYHWKGHLFTTYYCYELTNIQDRSFFFSIIDAMYCPVFNKDTYYFNNIAESCARDMHCYFILDNVSDYGDTRVTQPTKNERMNILRVKGGNAGSNKTIVLSANIEIAELRKFQMRDSDSDKNGDKGVKFKPLPPGFKKDDVRRRINERFLTQINEEWYEEFLRDLATQLMRYERRWID